MTMNVMYDRRMELNVLVRNDEDELDQCPLLNDAVCSALFDP